MNCELAPRIQTSKDVLSLTPRIFEEFLATRKKVAIQKDGELTSISRFILERFYGIQVPPKDPSEKCMLGVSKDGTCGIIYARNKGICDLVANGAADMAVVGTDRLIEDGAEDEVDVVACFEEQYSWPLVLATPLGSSVSSIEEIHCVATQYPVATRRYFDSQEISDVEIVPTVGSTELYPYLQYNGSPIDAVVDIQVTGASMSAHNLTVWSPSIGNVYPVLIQRKGMNGA